MNKKPFLSVTKIPIYDGVFVLAVTDTPKRYSVLAPLNDLETLNAHAFCASHEGMQGYFVALNLLNKNHSITNGVITHEAMHIVHFIADYAGIKVDTENDEALAYLIGWIVDEIYQTLSKKGFKVKTEI